MGGALEGVIFNSENTALERTAANEDSVSSLQLSVSRVKKSPAVCINLTLQGVKLDIPTMTGSVICQQNDPRTPTTSVLYHERLESQYH